MNALARFPEMFLCGTDMQYLLDARSCVIVSQEALKAQYYLWQLFQIEMDMIEERERASVQKKELNKTANLLYNSEKQVEEKKKVAAGFSKDRLLLERKHKKRKADLETKACTLRSLCPVNAGTNELFD